MEEEVALESASNVEKKITWLESARHPIVSTCETILDHVSNVRRWDINLMSVLMRVKTLLYQPTTMPPPVEGDGLHQEAMLVHGVTLLVQELEHGTVYRQQQLFLKMSGIRQRRMIHNKLPIIHGVEQK